MNRIHEKHTFIDEQIPGMDGCMKCHPGEQAQCLRGTMANDFGMECQDCHGVNPSGPGPHGIQPTDIIDSELMSAGGKLDIFPQPLKSRQSATILARNARGELGRMLVFDARGRTVRMLSPELVGDKRVRASWDGRDRQGNRLPSGVYFVRWEDGERSSAGKMVLVD